MRIRPVIWPRLLLLSHQRNARDGPSASVIPDAHGYRRTTRTMTSTASTDWTLRAARLASFNYWHRSKKQSRVAYGSSCTSAATTRGCKSLRP